MKSEIIESPQRARLRISEQGIRLPSGIALMPVLTPRQVPGDRRRSKNRKLARACGGRKMKPKRKRRYDLTRWIMIVPLVKANYYAQDFFQPDVARGQEGKI
jgi:hypothetical protein